MSKIYEALQRAEEERKHSKANSVSTETNLNVLAQESPALNHEAHAPSSPISNPGDAVSSTLLASSMSSAVLDSEADRQNGAGSGEVRTTVWKPNLEKLPALQDRGAAVEQFRTLRSRISSFRDMNTLKSIIVSSALPREGKSFIAANLALSLARHKASRVLLIDGDLRRSSLHTVLGCPKEPGLSTYLTGNATISEVMQRTVISGDANPLFAGLDEFTFIAGGDEGDTAADLSGNPAFKELIDQASEYFDWIVVDSSPVNLVRDGANLAQACDGVLLVARGGVTRFQAAQRALGELKDSKVLGVVLNAVETPPFVGYYGYDEYDTDPK